MSVRNLIVSSLVLFMAGCGGGGDAPPCPCADATVDADTGSDLALMIDLPVDSVQPDPGTDPTIEAKDLPVEIVKGQFGAPCLSNTDCESGLCVEGVEGFICTTPCLEDCPEGWVCRGILVGPDLVSLCVPIGANLCKPCKLDLQCGDGLCMAIGDGLFCGRDCQSEDCPAGYQCELVQRGDGTASQCLPVSGACDCNVTSQGYEKPCVVQSEYGTCLGLETCDMDLGWIGCSALVPSPEECNGVDDDCNGVADDGPEPPGEVCENEVLGVGSCPGQWICAGESGWDCAGPLPKIEGCNYLDDDCDGETDEDFQNDQGQYADLEHCGLCGNFCVGKIPFAETVICDETKEVPQCGVIECVAGYYVASDILCLALISNLCIPCDNDANCGATGDQCLDLDDGKHCGRDCSPGSVFGGECPDGYACTDLGEGVEQCVPLSGSCGCTPINAGIHRMCAIENEYGTCTGTETCDPSQGWVNCTANTPGLELCNGLDDDCNGLVDDGLEPPPELCENSWTDSATGETYQCIADWQCTEGGEGVIWVCDAAHPGPELCNYLDDNCNDQVDEDYKVPGTNKYGAYDHCGACGVSCQGLILNGTEKCDVAGSQPKCMVDECDPGFWKASELSCAEFPETLCKPCASDSACQVPGDTCEVAAADELKFCLWDCSPQSLHVEVGPDQKTCPLGYYCKETDESGNPWFKCMPASDTCDCLEVNGGDVRLCERTNEFGTCLGQETCDALMGWIGCTASTPQGEICNGLDDDCNGLTDDPFPELFAVCFVGTGECREAGILVCNPAGDGVECDAAPGVPVPENCDGLDNDCQGDVDEDWPDKGKVCSEGQGECLESGTWVCRADGLGVECDAAPGAPTLETCDGLDNDCQGDVDEDWPDKGKPCSEGIGECLQNGVKVCTADGSGIECNVAPGAPSPETCDGVDNDCMGDVDEDWPDKGKACSLGTGECHRNGVNVCTADGFGIECNAVPGVPVPETCDGLDNDCMGDVDEDWPEKGKVCTVGQGECIAAGTQACLADGSGLDCNAVPGVPTVETCDGLDNDCMGDVDEDWPDKGKVCTAGVGECLKNGVNLCKVDGSGIECDAVPGTPTPETCDGLDNDCQGDVDEDWPGKGKACLAGIGECLKNGVSLCKADGSGIECDAVAGTPVSETCNGKDDDCQGDVDEDWPDKGKVCTQGQGECLAAGTRACMADGSGLECNAVEGAPTGEKCDGLDNDCQGDVDEDWPDKGKACFAGVGECLRNGVNVCRADGSGIECDAIPGAAASESCDGLDNDCQGDVDEDWPDKGAVCLAGVGECQRAGTNVCKVDGSDIECDAVPGAPSAESCDGLDNDCQGDVDEDWPDKGAVCLAGVGECQRAGTNVCKVDGSGIECAAAAGPPGSEVCDLLDNNCDGQTDEPFKVGGLYAVNTACGNCFTDCTQIYALPNAFGTCAGAGTPTCVMNCVAPYYDMNGVPDDGCEFMLDVTAIYVSVDGPLAKDDGNCGLGPVGTLPGVYPCKSINQQNGGLARAVSTGRSKVLVADGLYEETVTLVNGKSLMGGYRADTWERHLDSTLAIIRGDNGGLHKKTIVADGITSATVVEGFLIYGTPNTQVGGNTYALWIRNGSSGLTIRHNSIYAGTAGPGPNGAHGSNGTLGKKGNPGSPAKEVSANCFEQCNTGMETTGGSGGSRTCTDTNVNVSGGNGGRAVCPDFDQSVNMCSFCGSNDNQTIASQSNGQQGGNGGGGGGSGGYDAMIDGECDVNNSCTCYVPSGEQDGANGMDGSAGSNGGAGSGCAGTAGSVSGSEWVGAGGSSGSVGGHGSGGGGGGAGGGVETYYYSAPQCAAHGTSDIGGSGGGGGSGGCRGTGGTAGSAGGGAFDVFLVWTGSPSSAPSIASNTLTRGFGGNGGQGGNGGTGGVGGAGSNGGASGSGSTATFCAPAGGKGGQGGQGGHGGGAGGGCGGVSYGFHAFGQGGLNLNAYKTSNTFLSGGSGGQGGAGGGSMGSIGSAGATGASSNYNF